jgi:alkanesulfonate monooxygenase SsuD/methylene tetrahydromethanopterin reductase-like flavin-dependent oxidoreductase (luciferase family)
VRPAIGIRLPNSGPLATPAAILNVALYSEALGFDTIWVHDHLAWPSHRRMHFAAGSVEAVGDALPDFFESLSLLGYLAGATRRIRLGVAGLVLPWRDPRVLGKQLATIHEMSGHRLVTGVAIGRFEDEFEAQQVAFRERGRITDEYLACLATLLGSSPVTTFRGERVRIEGAEYFPKAEDLPIWICGASPQAHRRLARFGRGWLPGPMTVDEYRLGAAQIAGALGAVGRSIDSVERGLEVFTAIAPTDDHAQAIARRTLERQWSDATRGAARALVGGPATIITRMREYTSAGVTHFELKFICHDVDMMRGMMRTYADRVVPSLYDQTRGSAQENGRW